MRPKGSVSRRGFASGVFGRAQINVDEIDELSPQQLQAVANTYQQLRGEIQSFGQKHAELESERNEHKCVFP